MLISKILNFRTNSATTTKQGLKNSSKPQTKKIDMNASELSDNYSRAWVNMYSSNAISRISVMSDYKNKTYGEKFSIPDNKKANGVKNRAQFIVLPEAFYDIEKAQEIVDYVKLNFGGDRNSSNRAMLLDNAVEARKKGNKVSEQFLLGDNLVQSRLDKAGEHLILSAETTDGNLKIQYDCAHCSILPDSYFSLRTIETPEYKIYCDNEVVTQAAKNYSYNSDGSINAEKFYNFDYTKGKDNFAVYENCSFKDNINGVMKENINDFRALYRYMDSFDAPFNMQGKLFYFENDNIKDETDKKVAYEYDNEAGWQTKTIEE